MFLDIQMPQLNGLGVVEAAANRQRRPVFVFVTADDEYARRAFEVMCWITPSSLSATRAFQRR